MAKRNRFDEVALRRNVVLEAENETKDAAIAARDAVIAELMEKQKAAPAAAPPPAPELDPVQIARAEYQVLRANDPYRAAEFLLNNPAIAHSRFG